MDGTLVASMGIWKDIDIEYLGRFGLEVPEGLQQDLEGLSFTETAHYFKKRFQIPDSIEEIKKTWNEMAMEAYTKKVALKDGAAEFLEFCKKKGLLLGIATSNSRELVDALLQEKGLASYFACVMTASEVNKSKPAPDIYLAVAEKLDVKPEHCLVFEDIVPGIMAGKNAGMTVCAIEDLYSAMQREEKKEAADFFVENYFEVLDLGETI